MFHIREFKNSDFKELIQHDSKMTRDLLGDNATPYDENWLHDLTKPDRKKYLSYNTLVAAIGDSGESDKNNNDDDIDHDRPIGFAILHLRKRALSMAKAGARKRIRKHFVEIFFLSVASEHQNRGIGGRLIDAADKWAISQNAIELRLAVIDSHVHAIRFYARNRFEDIGSMENYPEAGVVSRRMRRRCCETK